MRSELKVRRALLSVSDKAGVVELARALSDAGAELVATGKTARVLEDAGLRIVPIEKISGSPEAFQGRMKTLSFPVCSGILYRRGDASDEADLARLGAQAIDCVVVNFYPFEQAAAREGISRQELIEEVDIGGPTLVRAAAKNSPEVLVLTDPVQYGRVIADLRERRGVSTPVVDACAARAWERVLAYDRAIAERLGERSVEGELARQRVYEGELARQRVYEGELARQRVYEGGTRRLRYGENPHQQGRLEFDPAGPIDWGLALTPTELSYNNILDLSSAYHLVSDLVEIDPGCASVVIIKHNNPCGAAMIPKGRPDAQKEALLRAWDGDSVSAFGGVLAFSDPLEESTAAWLSERFVELVAAPGLTPESAPLRAMLAKRKNLKAVSIRRFGELPRETVVAVPGGRLYQAPDTGTKETFKPVTKAPWPKDSEKLSRFGVAVCRTLKSNAITLVREIPGISGSTQLVGAGQGQPNRIDSLKVLAVPRARAMGADLAACLMVSDAFFPFRDTVDAAFEAGIRSIIQPGGSIKDAESIAACDEHGLAMVFSGVRHFKH